MSGTSLAGIILIVVVIVAGLGTWLALVAFAAKRPYFKHPQVDQRAGDIRGGIHKGDPRERRASARRSGGPLEVIAASGDNLVRLRHRCRW